MLIPSSNIKIVRTGGICQLENFIRCANKAKIHTEESGFGGHTGVWGVLDRSKVKASAQDIQDEDEWVTVDKEQVQEASVEDGAIARKTRTP
jgi:hypothetical protein